MTGKPGPRAALLAAALLPAACSEAPPTASDAVRIVRIAARPPLAAAPAQAATSAVAAAHEAADASLDGAYEAAEDAWQEAAQTAARAADPYRVRDSVLADTAPAAE